MRKTILLVMLSILLFTFHLSTVQANNTIEQFIKVEINIPAKDYHLLEDKLVEIRVYSGDKPHGNEIGTIYHYAEHLIPEKETQTTGSLTPKVEIPVYNGENKDYHVRVGYFGGKLYGDYISIRVRSNGVTTKSAGGWAFTTFMPTINIPIPDPKDFVSIDSDTSSETTDVLQPDHRSSGLWGDPRPDDSIIAKMFTRLVKDFMGALWNFFGVQDPVTLFFNVDPEILFERFSEDNMERHGMSFLSRPDNSMYVDPAADDTFLYTFSLEEYGLMNLMFNEFNKFLQIPYAVAIAIIGLLLFLKGYNSEDRSTIKIFIGSMLFFPMLIKFFPYLLEPLFWLNLTVIRAVGSAIENGLGIPLTDPFITTLIGSGTALNSIGVIIGTFFLFAAVGLLNFQYFIRRFMLAILIMMFPIVAFLQVFPSNRKILSMWFSEFLANLFLQSAHAIVYLVFIGLIYYVQAPFIPVMAMLITLSTFSGFVRNLMGCQSNSNMAGNMMGISAIFGAGRIAGGILGGISGQKSNEAEKAKTSLQTAQSSSAAAGAASSEIQEGTSETLSNQPAEQTTKTELTGKESTPSTGTAWGIAPRMHTDLKGTLRKLGAGTVVGGAMATGAIVGSSAAGSAGFGFGAMGGAKSSEYILKGGAYTKDVAGNIYDKESKIRKIQEEMGFTRDDAIAYAATGVETTPEETMFDEEMTAQVSNYKDVAGFSDYYKNRKDKYALAHAHEYLKEGHSFESVRKDAAKLRDELAGQNLSVPEANYRVLNEVIRPAMKPAPAPSQPLDMNSIRDMNRLRGQSLVENYGGYKDMEAIGVNAQDYTNSFKTKSGEEYLKRKERETYNEMMRNNYDPDNW